MKYYKKKTPMAPLKKKYLLTDSREKILQMKISQNFETQVGYLKDSLVELVANYIQSVAEEEREEKLLEVQNVLDEKFGSIKTTVFVKIVLEGKCPDCEAKLDGENSNFCSNCGFDLKEIMENQVRL